MPRPGTSAAAPRSGARASMIRALLLLLLVATALVGSVGCGSSNSGAARGGGGTWWNPFDGDKTRVPKANNKPTPVMSVFGDADY